MKSLALFFCGVLFSSVLMAAEPVPSGPLKVFKGPEGELVAMVEVNNSKEILVQYKKTGGEVEGKTRLYTLVDEGRDRRSATYQKKQGSKMITLYPLAYRHGTWYMQNPVRRGEIPLTYSEKDSEKMKIEDVLKAYKP